jgi:hypothetical protein
MGTSAERVARIGSARRSARAPDTGLARVAAADAGARAGRPLEPAVRSFMESRFERDFSSVRLHTNARAASSAHERGAAAYAYGDDVVFAAGQYRPQTPGGLHLLAHELAHVVQQSSGVAVPARRAAREPAAEAAPALEAEAERAATNAISGRARPDVSPRSAQPVVQFQRASLQIRSPVFEEAATQLSDIAGAAGGRTLTPSERALAQPVFGSSIDLDRVRLVALEVLEYRTVGNNIYIPPRFTVSDAYMAQTLIHELTHVWQYQHGGTHYISESLAAQIGAALSSGSRNAAYVYSIQAGQSFFDFSPEQQGSIVENYFAMQRDQREIPAALASGTAGSYLSNQSGSLNARERLAEISAELPLHQPLIEQLRASLPRSEVDVLRLRALDVMQSPPDPLRSPERELAPVRPLLELRF